MVAVLFCQAIDVDGIYPNYAKVHLGAIPPNSIQGLMPVLAVYLLKFQMLRYSDIKSFVENQPLFKSSTQLYNVDCQLVNL